MSQKGYTLLELPFKRGTSANNESTLTLSDTVPDAGVEGRLYAVPDTVHGTGRFVILRLVKNDTGGDITIDNDDRLFRAFSSTDALADFERRISGTAGDGAVCRPIDDAYPDGYVIAKWDHFYVVEQGPCYMTTGATAVDLSAGDPVVSDSAGAIRAAAASLGNYVVAVIDADTTDEDTQVVIHVGSDSWDPPGAATNGEILTATNSLTAADHGKTFYLTNATEFTTTLPAIADAGLGWEVEFIITLVPNGANMIITEDGTADTNTVYGSINECTVDTGTDGDFTNGTAVTFINFIADTAAIGDSVRIRCNGTNWFVIGQCEAAGGITLT